MKVKCLSFIFLTFLIFAASGLSQSRSERQAQKLKQRWQEMYSKVFKILNEEYSYDHFIARKKLSPEQRRFYRDNLFSMYEPLAVNTRVNPDDFYNRHLHPIKIHELKRQGIDFFQSPPTFLSKILHAETIIIGHVKRFTYHPKKGNWYHTSVHIFVDEFLRDDYGLSKQTNEVILKLISGPVGNEGKWVKTDHEEVLSIGQQYLFYLMRAGYVMSLVGNQRNFSKEELGYNVFASAFARELPVMDSKVRWRYNEYLRLDEVISGIKKVTEILDVQSFYDQ